MQDSAIEQMRSHALDVAAFLKALANENRLLILCSLLDGEKNVGQINRSITLSPSALSQHLAWLRDAGLVTTRRQSQVIFYQITDNRVVQVMTVLKQLFCEDPRS